MKSSNFILHYLGFDVLNFDKKIVDAYMKVRRSDVRLANIIAQEMIVNPELGEEMYMMFCKGARKKDILDRMESFLRQFRINNI